LLAGNASVCAEKHCVLLTSEYTKIAGQAATLLQKACNLALPGAEKYI